MGSGDRQKQIERRFNQGKPHFEFHKPKQECSSPYTQSIVLGNYLIGITDQGYLLTHNGQELGKYKELLRVEGNRALFKLDKGMLLEVTPKGIREIFTIEKARVHAIIASEGSLYHDPEQGKYEIKVVCKSTELIDIFREDFKKVYNQELNLSVDHNIYPRAIKYSKAVFNDIKAYGARQGNSMWRVPRERLDHEGAREWLKMFMSGDGNIGYRRGNVRVRFYSINWKGLEQIQELLDHEFGIASKLSVIDRKAKMGYSYYDYVLEIKPTKNARRYIIEIGSYKQDHREKIAEALGE